MVLATNIAETSLTIEDVVYVVDTGKLKARLAHVAVLELEHALVLPLSIATVGFVG